jgi:hypothetical protein
LDSILLWDIATTLLHYVVMRAPNLNLKEQISLIVSPIGTVAQLRPNVHDRATVRTVTRRISTAAARVQFHAKSW